VRVAAKMDIPLRVAEADVRGTFPWGPGVTDITMKNLVVVLTLKGDASQERLKELALKAEETCYLSQSVKHPVLTKTVFRLNDVEVEA
jgi:organic hydroperoxide reductase OsmC/OhrA